jgi:hypothetical protein
MTKRNTRRDVSHPKPTARADERPQRLSADAPSAAQPTSGTAARAAEGRESDELAELFRSWREDEDEQEQKETWEYLRRTLDEDRPSKRPLFP